MLNVFVMAVVLDCVYQFLVFRWVYPFEAMATATVLAILPYVLLRDHVSETGRSISRRPSRRMSWSAPACEQDLGLSTRTVRAMKYEMMEVLGVTSTAELVRYALDCRINVD